LVEQVEVTTEKQFADEYARLLSEGAEGAMLKSSMLYYECARTKALLKAKPTHHGTGTVVGWTWGALADNRFALVGESQGTWLGAMGTAQIAWNNRLFELGGFTLKERQMVYKGTQSCAADEGLLHPGQDCDTAKVESPLFPLGSQLSFAYIELTAAGIPRSARYARNATPSEE
jgi:ATP-dependent DNA ligase